MLLRGRARRYKTTCCARGTSSQRVFPAAARLLPAYNLRVKDSAAQDTTHAHKLCLPAEAKSSRLSLACPLRLHSSIRLHLLLLLISRHPNVRMPWAILLATLDRPLPPTVPSPVTVTTCVSYTLC